jgi:deoxyribodipyrimidine photolyase-related protein
MKKNYLGNDRHLDMTWYTGTTGILPIDITVKQAFKYGYLHHINRLMIMCNFMNLCQIKPDDAYKWFMEFSLDSYDWVMILNVYSMGMYADGGLTTTKPYISSSNYIMKMSNFTNTNSNWREIWDALYYNFIKNNYKKLKGRASIFRFQYDHLTSERKNEIVSISRKFLHKN